MGVGSNLACFGVSVAAGFAFVAVERRVPVPLLDLALLRNRVLVGATVAILIGAGTINGLMYLFSLYFQDENTLGFTPLQAGLATQPATVGLVLVAPLVPRLAARFGGRQVIGVGFEVTTGGFAAIGFVQPSWRYLAFLLPLIAAAVGWGYPMGLLPPRRRLPFPQTRSERRPVFRIWPAMSARRWQRPWLRRSTPR
jgi:Na+/melibiose symporter-like transporter